MNEEPDKADNASQLATKPRSWRLRFTLRLMLGLVTLLGIMLGWWTHRARQQQRLVERIMSSKGGAIEYDYPRDPRTDEPLESNVPKFFRQSIKNAKLTLRLSDVAIRKCCPLRPLELEVAHPTMNQRIVIVTNEESAVRIIEPLLIVSLEPGSPNAKRGNGPQKKKKSGE